MWYFTVLADWWDKQREQSEHMLDRFVQRNPNQFGIVDQVMMSCTHA